MVGLKPWLRDQGLSVRELVVQLDLPLKTVEDWVHRGAVPSPYNNERLNEFIGGRMHPPLGDRGLYSSIARRAGASKLIPWKL